MRNGEEEKASVGRSSETFSCEDRAEGKSCKETRGEGVLQRRAALKPVDLLSGVTRREGESWELRERTRVGRGWGGGSPALSLVLHCSYKGDQEASEAENRSRAREPERPGACIPGILFS